MLGRICLILAVKGFPGVAVKAATAGRKPPAEAGGRWAQTGLEEPSCWRSSSEPPGSVERRPVHQSTVQQSESHTGYRWRCHDLPHCSPCHRRWWTLWTCSEPAAATEPQTQTSPGGMNPALLDPGNKPGLLTCTQTLAVTLPRVKKKTFSGNLTETVTEKTSILLHTWHCHTTCQNLSKSS